MQHESISLDIEMFENLNGLVIESLFTMEATLCSTNAIIRVSIFFDHCIAK